MTTIYCFGSNLSGRHSKGTALYAREHHGAIYGQGNGLQGTSYAIPTKDGTLKPLPLPTIRKFVREFIDFAIKHPELTFQITKIGCGLAGYKPEDIAPMFINSPKNCILPEEFLKVLNG